jgi:hypothetical protein
VDGFIYKGSMWGKKISEKKRSHTLSCYPVASLRGGARGWTRTSFLQLFKKKIVKLNNYWIILIIKHKIFFALCSPPLNPRMILIIIFGHSYSSILLHFWKPYPTSHSAMFGRGDWYCFYVAHFAHNMHDAQDAASHA